MKTIKWNRPSGVPIETNDLKETIEYCKSLGWTESNPEVKKKRIRRTKEQIEQDKLK